MIRFKEKTIDYSKFVISYIKYKKDIVKFVKDCIYVEQPGESVPKKLKLDYIQKKILRAFKKDHYLCLLNSRQVGTSTMLKAIVLHSVVFHNNCNIGIISHNKSLKSDIDYMIDHLPHWLKPKYIIKTTNKSIFVNGSGIYQSPTYNPHTVFIGKCINILLVDDAAFIRNLEEIFNGLYPAFFTTAMASKKQGIPYGIITSSIPNKHKVGKYFKTIWKNSKNGSNFYKPIKVYWKRIARFREDPTWYKNRCMLLNDKKRIDQELNLKFI